VFLGNKEKIQFHIHDFANQTQEAGECIITDSVNAHGGLWKLSIYPRGRTESDTGYVYIYMFFKGVDNESDPPDVKAMIRTKTISRELEKSTNKRLVGCHKFSTRNDIIENDCNDDGTLTITVEIEIATEKKPVWFPRLLKHGGDNNNSISAQLYRSIEKTSDVTVVVVGNTSRKEFKVHKCILELRAKSLYELILTEEESNNNNNNNNNNNEDGNDDTIITLPDTEEKAFEAFLEFAYTGKEPELNKDDDNDDEDIAKSILDAANRFGCTDLKLYIESVLVEKFLVASNTAALLLLSDSYSCALLKEAAMNVYIKDTKTVIESKADWTKLTESNDLLLELLLYATTGHKKYSSVVDDGDGTLDDVDDFDVTSLRERLEKVNLDVDGSRQILVERWKNYLRPANDDNENQNQNKRQRTE